MDDVATAISKRFRSMAGFFDERMGRLVTAAEAEALGFGGTSVVVRATGVSRRAVDVGRKELQQAQPQAMKKRIRPPGSGRKRIVGEDPGLKQALLEMVEESTRGDPMSPPLRTCKSVRRLGQEPEKQGHRASYPLIAERLSAV